MHISEIVKRFKYIIFHKLVQASKSVFWFQSPITTFLPFWLLPTNSLENLIMKKCTPSSNVNIVFILKNIKYLIIYQNYENRSFTLGKFSEVCFCHLHCLLLIILTGQTCFPGTGPNFPTLWTWGLLKLSV